MTYRLGVDVGGTFTDLLLIDDDTGTTFRAKTPSTPDDPSQGVLAGLEKVTADLDIGPDDLGHVMHGTTVATNAVLEGKGATVGLLVTRGYRQVLHIARSFVPGGLAGWIIWNKPAPLAALEHTVEVDGRIDARGTEITPLDEASVRDALGRLEQRRVEALTISFVNSFADPGHERRAADISRELLGDIPISLSSEILPEIREYERTLTTVANAYVQPRVSHYIGNLSKELTNRGVTAELHILRSDGGLMSTDAATSAPVNMLLSGPAGGVAGALWIARQAGYDNLLTLDMGGTSTDVALVEDGRPRIGRETEVGVLRVRASSIDVRTVGAGGGSVAHVPELTGALRVGPESAGADPGPAAYGRGGEQPTVTDANVVLGYLPPSLLGGEMALDVDAATTAVTTIADAMVVDVKRAAAGIVDIVNENMFGALRLVSVQQGYDPRDFALVAFGGAGPLHANALGRLMGSWPVIIPPSPGVLCAYGDATTRLRNEAARTFIRRFSETSDDQVAGILRELEAEASHAVAADGDRADDDGTTTRFQVDVRYHGQGFELPVEVDLDGLALEQVGAEFDTEHEQLFTFALDAEHEIVNLRAVVLSSESTVQAERIDGGGDDPSAAATGTTSVYVDDRDVDATLYDRAALQAGNRIAGPAIVTEMDSTTLILPGHTGEVDQFGNILIRPDDGAGADHVGAPTMEA
ncbi:MAG: hydantoinase/oxoprolinase family protein [Actinobacteria bacterium]|nr:hydantoinase/oxoprolinase family protein [Actinomycetota bacterium]